MIPVNTPLFAGNEKKYLLECIDTGWISSEGPFVQKFEENFSAKVQRQYAVAVSSGSAALDCAMQALQLPAGSEVIVPTFTIISCVASIVRAGCIPVLVDAEADTWNMDVSTLRNKITPGTSAIMVVHIYGLPVDMEPVLKLAKEFDLKIIEDAAEQHGQLYNDKPIGSFGDISVFSFYPNKHITTGEGGMIVTDNPELAERCRSIRNLCFIPSKRFYHEELGHNFRITNLQAAVGLAQLEQLDTFIERKRRMGSYYDVRLSGVSVLQLPLKSKSFAENIYWVFGVVLTDDYPHDAAYVMNKLAALGIGTRPFFYPMHKQPVFHKMGLFNSESLPVSERLAERGFYIPSGLALTTADQDIVLESLLTILNEN